MPTSRIKPRQIAELPISWLSEGRLRASILLRHSSASSDKLSGFFDLMSSERLSPKRLSELSTLQGYNDELLEKASKDYLRCVLAKSVSNVYRNTTNRYRNESARKQFFVKLLEVFEACLLSDSADASSKLQAVSEADRVVSWVKSEFDRLIDQRYDINSEHDAKLFAARAEFGRDLKQLEEITGCSWRESERFNKSLSVTSVFPSGLVENQNTWRWGTQWYPDIGVLNINPPMLFMDTIRRGLVAREVAVLLSPRILDRMPDAPRALCEQSEYLAYRLLESTNEKELWSQARHGPRQVTRLTSQALIDFFQYYEMMVGPLLYRELWSRLKEFGTARMTIADYNIIFNTLASRPTRHAFTSGELRLLNLLAKRPDIRAGEAARTLRLSIPTTMKALRDLARNAGLRFTVIVDMRRLGLVEHLALINSDRVGDLLRILSRFPFCRQVFRTYGSSDLFCVFDIPTEHSGFTREFLGDMTSKGLTSDFKLVTLEVDLQAVNFGRYDALDGRWNVHWDSWGINLRESLARDQPDVILSYQEERCRLDKLDLRILSSLQLDCRMPYAAIGRSLGVSGAYAGRKIERMARERVFRYAVWPLKIGAEDWGIVSLSCSNSVASILAKYLSDLPAWRGGLVSGDFSGLAAIVWTPSGEMKQFFKAIDDRLIRNGKAEARCFSTVGEWIIARWLPVDPYPWDLANENGDWIFDENRYRSLVA